MLVDVGVGTGWIAFGAHPLMIAMASMVVRAMRYIFVSNLEWFLLQKF